MSEDKPVSLVPNTAALAALEATLKAEMELAGGLGAKGKMALASLGALHTEIGELIVLAGKPVVIPEEAMQDGLLQQSYILQFEQDELGLRIADLDQAAEDLFTALTQAVFQYRQALQNATNLEANLLTADTLRKIAIASRTLNIHHSLAPALQSQIRGLANAIRVLRLETLAASLDLLSRQAASKQI